MALLMVLPMACLMVVLFALRTQTPIGDIQYMKAMIPHHSSAVMASKHAVGFLNTVTAKNSHC